LANLITDSRGQTAGGYREVGEVALAGDWVDRARHYRGTKDANYGHRQPRRAMATRVTSVVGGGLPDTERRH
jgi:hypothetical protein